MKKRSLRFKFVSSISLITLLVLLITLVVSVFISVRLFHDALDDSLEQAARHGQAEVSAWFTDKETMLTIVADDMRMFGYEEKDAVEHYLSHYHTNYPYLIDIYVGIPDNIMYSGAYRVPDEGYDVRERPWYVNARESGKLVYTEPYLDVMSNQMVITISKPVTDRDGRDFGVLSMDIKLDSLVEYINESKIMETSGQAFLLDSSQHVIVHEQEDFLPRMNGEQEEYTNFSATGVEMNHSDLANGAAFLAKDKDYTDQEVYLTAIEIPQNGWIYGFAIPADDFMPVYQALILKWVAILLSMVLVSVLLSVLMTRRLLVPIQTIIQAAGKLATGDVNVQLSVKTGDELEELSKQFQSMVESTAQQIAAMQQVAQGDFTAVITPKSDKDELSTAMNEVIMTLSGIIREVNGAAGQVREGAMQIAAGAQALAIGSTEQAAAVEELSSSIGDILNQSQDSALQAQEALQDSKKAGDYMGESLDSMQRMITAMTEINNASNAISQVISVIDSIAFQTNILSLNASVEAARAGQYGKGFAVVAEEVRNLAIKSAEAAKETAELIQNSIARVNEGNAIAQQTSQSLGLVADLSERNAAAMESISMASKQQSAAIAEINKGIEQISSVVHSNSATAEESAASSGEMSNQAEILSKLMGRFRVTPEGRKEASLCDEMGRGQVGETVYANSI